MSQRRWRVDERASADSTQDIVLAGRDRPDGWVVFTDDQRHGRGRHGRTWSTPPGSGIAMSILLRPRMSQEQWPWLPLALGLSVRDVLAAHGVAAHVKWPNDIVVVRAGVPHKIAGILTNVAGDAIVLGVGINTRMTQDQVPIPLATSLSIEGVDNVDGRTLVNEVLDRFGSACERLESGAVLIDQFRQACITLGQQVRVTTVDGRHLHGTAAEVTTSGALVVESESGSEIITAGDVEHVRTTN